MKNHPIKANIEAEVGQIIASEDIKHQVKEWLERRSEMGDKLAKELEKRGTAEITNGVVNQITQALDEKDTEVEFLIFGEKTKKYIMPIDEACAKCNFWKGKFETIKLCQEAQFKDASARGFGKLICPKQFMD